MLASEGNGRAVAWSNSLTCDGVRVRCRERARAATPATSGVEKLVPTDVLKLSLYVERTGTVVPESVVVRMGYRHGESLDVLTQLPPGALIATSGPIEEKPTFVPTWRSPATATTPLQLAGVATE